MKVTTKFLALLMAMLMLVSLATGCGGGEDASNPTESTSSSVTPDSSVDSSVSDATSAEDSNVPDATTDANGDGGETSNTTQGGDTPDTPDKPAPETPDKPDPETPVKPDPENKSQIVVWGNKSDITLATAMAEFRKKYPDQPIKLTNPPLNTSVSAIKTAIMSGTGPDVLYMDHVYITSLGTEGVFADLRPYGADKIKNKFTPSTWEANTVNGKVYGLPWSANVICFMYDKEMFGKAGVTKAPTNFEELLEAGEKIKATGKIPYTLPLASNENDNMNWAAFNYFFWLWREGGDILKTEGGRYRAAFNGPEGVEALQKIITLKQRGLIPMDYKELDFGGKVAMIDMGNWKIADVANKREKGLALMPTLKEGVPGYSGLGLFSYGVSAKSKNPQAAYNFIELLTTNAKLQIKYNGEKQITPLIEAQQNKVYTTGANKDSWKVFFEQLKYSKFRPGIPGWSDIEKSVASAVYSAVSGSKNPKDALDAAAKVVNSRLDRLYR